MSDLLVKASKLAVGVMAVSLSAFGAARAQEFAPGVNCEGLSCTNDSDEPYVASGVTYCLTNPANTPPMPGQQPTAPTPYTNAMSVVVNPHSTMTLTPICRGGDSMTGAAITGVAPGSALPPSGSGG
ncbi:hypothetical protein OHB26_35455 [Nocardia sp. NBC_01503]|uniref:hypothetical protein n=1 Tax=Nocardia sp. NBC_01503 TaxID=2975997 RepID=UPI002E7AFE0A|nr:hypothetical protein [Nocardia sp. NBC_01503]WTL32130.1 hypothetical protein OHB26_35455 [Nocardia sp. NBC_01503]